MECGERTTTGLDSATGPYLIASIHTALDDSQLVRFQPDLVEQIGRSARAGVIIDVAALDVLDSFAAHTLRNIAEMARLRGAVTVIVGIQPDVAFAMVALGLDTGSVQTALDLGALGLVIRWQTAA